MIAQSVRTAVRPGSAGLVERVQALPRMLSAIGRGLPFVGGGVSAAFDAYLLKRIADHAKEEFPQRAGAIGSSATAASGQVTPS